MRSVHVAAYCLLGASLLAGCGGSIAVPAVPSHSPSPASPPAYPGLIYINGVGSSIDVFSTEASGNIAPSRVIAGSSVPAGTDVAGLWGVDVAYGGIENLSNLPVPPYKSAGATHYSAAGGMLAKIVLPPIPDSFGSSYIVGAVAGATDAAGNFYLGDGIRDVSTNLETEPLFDCELVDRLQVDEYAANATGTPVPIRTIALPFQCAIWSLTVDDAGNLWVAGDSSILEYAAGATGAATPIRTIDLKFDYVGLSLDGSANPGFGPSIAVDSAGNLYTTLLTLNDKEILRYGRSNKPQRYLSDVYPMALAFDAHDDLFVTGYFGAGRIGIAEFKYPSDVPLRIITGSKTAGAATSPGLAVTR